MMHFGYFSFSTIYLELKRQIHVRLYAPVVPLKTIPDFRAAHTYIAYTGEYLLPSPPSWGCRIHLILVVLERTAVGDKIKRDNSASVTIKAKTTSCEKQGATPKEKSSSSAEHLSLGNCGSNSKGLKLSNL